MFVDFFFFFWGGEGVFCKHSIPFQATLGKWRSGYISGNVFLTEGLYTYHVNLMEIVPWFNLQKQGRIHLGGLLVSLWQVQLLKDQNEAPCNGASLGLCIVWLPETETRKESRVPRPSQPFEWDFARLFVYPINCWLKLCLTDLTKSITVCKILNLFLSSTSVGLLKERE